MPRGQIIARSPGTWLVRSYQGRDPATGKVHIAYGDVGGFGDVGQAALPETVCAYRKYRTE